MSVQVVRTLFLTLVGGCWGARIRIRFLENMVRIRVPYSGCSNKPRYGSGSSDLDPDLGDRIRNTAANEI